MRTPTWANTERVCFAIGMVLVIVVMRVTAFCTGYYMGTRHTESTVKTLWDYNAKKKDMPVPENDKTDSPVLLAKPPATLPDEVRVTPGGECYHLRETCPSLLGVRGVRIRRPCMICANPYSRHVGLARRGEW